MEGRPPAKRGKTLFSFFKKNDQISEVTLPGRVNEEIPLTPTVDPSPISCPEINNPSSSNPALQLPNNIERDPGKRQQMYERPVNLRDDIRRSYLTIGPYQPQLAEYRSTKGKTQSRRFQRRWFNQFHWLEYSPTTNKAYCFYCFLFLNDSNPYNCSALVTHGYDNWKRVNDGAKCAFLVHAASSTHIMNVRKAEDLMKPSQHIDKVITSISNEEYRKHRLRVTTTVKSVRWLALQGCAFRGHDESSSSLNRGNFIEMVDAFGQLNTEIGNVVLDNAPRNATYTSPKIQKEILNIMANRVRKIIRDEVGDAKFCILVDEAQDQAKREQMAIILRFVNSDGILTERFFAIKSVSDTTSLNLFNKISEVFVRNNLQIENLRGQGYDGASNMRGTWNGLQALFLRHCPYAYYVHCFAHRLQLTLVSAAKDVSVVWQFFSHVDNIVNIITSSPKYITELQVAQRKDIKHLLAIGERESGSGANQIGNLQRAGATRWSSHYESIKSLIDMYTATCKVLEGLKDHSPNARSRDEAVGAYKKFTSFKFVFVLHLMRKILAITDMLCQALQRKNQDIVNAIRCVSSTRKVLQELRDDGWNEFLQEVNTFCSNKDIEIPVLDSSYKTGRSHEHTTVEHHYHFDVFNEVIDSLLTELNTRFNEQSIELLSLSAALDPRNSFELFNKGHILELAKKFYPADFKPDEVFALDVELQHYKHDVICDPQFQVPTLSELCRQLIVTKRCLNYQQLTRLIYMVLTLPVSTATTERAFSAMKILKTELRNKMEDDFLADCMTIYIERDFAANIDVESIVEEFYAVGHRRIPHP